MAGGDAARPGVGAERAPRHGAGATADLNGGRPLPWLADEERRLPYCGRAELYCSTMRQVPVPSCAIVRLKRAGSSAVLPSHRSRRTA
jgi:hypothetical protein